MDGKFGFSPLVASGFFWEGRGVEGLSIAVIVIAQEA